MKTQARNGVLGLDTAKAVLIAFLVLSVLGIATLLTLNSLSNSSIANTIDIQTQGFAIINETEANVTTGGYTLSGYSSSWSGMVITAIWANSTSQYNVSVPTTSAAVSSLGVVTNATSTQYLNVSISYTYTNSTNLGRTASIENNISNGLTTFFASTGTIFSILIVVVIILAISIIIWAVGRFGNTAEQSVNL